MLVAWQGWCTVGWSGQGRHGVIGGGGAAGVARDLGDASRAWWADGGGADRFEQVASMAGKEVTVLSTWTTEAEVLMAATLRQAGVKVILVGPAHGPFRRHAAVRREVWQAVARADVVHIHGLWEDIQHEAASAAVRLGMPYIMRPCGMLDPWSLARSPGAKTFRVHGMAIAAAFEPGFGDSPRRPRRNARRWRSWDWRRRYRRAAGG